MKERITLQQVLEDIAKKYKLSHTLAQQLVEEITRIMDTYLDEDEQNGKK